MTVYYRPNIHAPKAFIACYMSSEHITVTSFVPVEIREYEDDKGGYKVPVYTLGQLDQRLGQDRGYFPHTPEVKLVRGEHLRSELATLWFVEKSAISLKRSELLGSVEWSDHARWVFGVDREGRLSTPFNSVLETAISKAPVTRTLVDRQVSAAVQVFVKFRDHNFSAVDALVTYHPDLQFKTNTLDVKPYLDSYTFDHFYPRIIVDGPDTIGDLATVQVRLVDENDEPIVKSTELFLEVISGYVPTIRVNLVDGVGSFRVLPLGLNAGEKIRVKIGWRQWTGVAEYVAVVL